jgi:WD40 repeat protein
MGQSSAPRGVKLQLHGRALSWSDDRTLRLWDVERGTSQAFLGDTGSVRGALPLSNGRALSWALDNTLRLWDLKKQRQIGLYVGDDPLAVVLQGEDGHRIVYGTFAGQVRQMMLC